MAKAKKNGYVALVDFKDARQYGTASYKKGSEIRWTDEDRIEKAVEKGIIKATDVADEPEAPAKPAPETK